MYSCPSFTHEKSEAWRDDLSKPHKQLSAWSRALSTASAVSLCPPPPAQPSPREGTNEAGAGRGRGRLYAHRCRQVHPWRPDLGLAPLCPACLLSPCGMWLVPLSGGVEALHVSVPCQDPTLETQSLSPKGDRAVIPILGSLGVAGGAPGPQAWLEDWGAEDTSGRQ